MPKKVQIQVFRFKELSEKVQQKVIDAERQAYHEDGIISDEVKDRFIDLLMERGLPTGKIHWGLSHSQGDGVAFYGKIDLEDYFEKNKLASEFPTLYPHLPTCSIKIVKVGPHMYDHYNTMDLDAEDHFDWKDEEEANLNRDKAKAEFERLVKDLESTIKDVSRKLEKEGYEIIDSYDDDYFKEWLGEREDSWYYQNGQVYQE